MTMSAGFHRTVLLGLACTLAGCLMPRATDLLTPPDLSAPAKGGLLAAPPVEVVRGTSVLPIVTDDSSNGRATALFLADVIERTCGRRPDMLVVFRGQDCAVSNALFIGHSTDTSSAAFRVRAYDGSVRFEGRSDYAVFDWCERFLGYRIYCADGECFARQNEIVVPAVDYADRPVFDRRILTGNPKWARVAKSGNEHRGGVAVHQPHNWFRDAALKAAHPDIFENGKTPMLCYGNPETREVYLERINRQITDGSDAGGIVNTNRKVITVSPWDAPIRCACAHCRGCYADKSASPIVWGKFLPALAREVKAAHPDYLVSFLPYLNFVEVPEGLEGLPDNCEAEVCTMPGLALLKDEATRAREEALLRRWQKVTGRKVLSWDYGCWPLDKTSAPYVFGRTAQRHCAAMRDVISGTFICGGEDDPRVALSLYVWMRCLWNPDIDVEAIYDGFARRMFGPAAAAMRELIALQEACWERMWDGPVCTYRNVFETSFRPDDVERMRALLQEGYARACAAQDAASALRVRWYADGFKEFFRDCAVLEARPASRPLMAGEMRRMVRAREPSEEPWAATEVSFVRSGSSNLTFTVRCLEPAAAKIDFSSIDDDWVHGDDCVTVIFKGQPPVKVFRNDARVTHTDADWTVTIEVPLPAEAVRAGCIYGNVIRFRVGDRRFPEANRVPGSRYEHSRLWTMLTAPDDDPSAFVPFHFAPVR